MLFFWNCIQFEPLKSYLGPLNLHSIGLDGPLSKLKDFPVMLHLIKKSCGKREGLKHVVKTKILPTRRSSVQTFAETCMWGTVTSHHAGCQEVGRCHTRGESHGTYIIHASAKCQ